MMYPVTKFVGLFKKLDQNLWDIDDELGKINVLSRLSSNVVDNFLLTKENRKVLNSINDSKRKECKSDGCRLSQRVHRLNDKLARILWKRIPKSDRSVYDKIASILKRFFETQEGVYYFIKDRVSMF